MAKKPHNIFKQWLSFHGWYVCAISMVFFATTIPFVTHYPFNWDAAQFTLGVTHFSVEMHQPHPPGYPLFIAVAKLFALLVSPHTALLIESIGFGLIATLGMYVLVYEIWRRRWLAGTVALVWLVNPVFWLYRETALTYTIDTAAVILLLFFSIRLFSNQRPQRYAYYSAITLALLGGFRPSMIILLAPILVFQWIYIRSWKIAAKSLVLAIIVSLSWYIPMLMASDSLTAYRAASQALYAQSASVNSVFYGAGWTKTVQQIHFTIVTALVSWNSILVLMVAGLATAIYKRTEGRPLLATRYVWLAVSCLIMPMLIFGFIHIGQLGYVLIILPMGYLIAAYAIMEIRQIVYRPVRWIGLCFVGLIGFLHASVFLFITPDYTHPEFIPKTRLDVWFQHTARYAPQLFKVNAALLHQNDARTENIIQAVRQYAPDEVLVIAGRNIQYPASNGLMIRNDELFRELSAMLPEYEVIQVASDSDEYLLAQDYQMHTLLTSSPHRLSPSVKYIIIALDKIPLGNEPDGLPLALQVIPGGQQYYLGEFSDPFSFYDVTVKLLKAKSNK